MRSNVAGLILAMFAPVPAAASDIKSDEVVRFFNTWAYPEPDGQHWIIPIHGWIYEPELDSLRRDLALKAFAEALDLDESHAKEALFRARARPFIVDNERGKVVQVRLGDQTYAMGESGHNGHFTGTVRLSARDVERLSKPDRYGRRWLSFEAVTRAGDRRTFAGAVLILEPTGLSVISDIDDTIRISEVHDAKALLANTFVREFKAVPGMADVYKKWAAQGACFHYVSSSPWQLYDALTEFMAAEGFPVGTFDLKTFRWKDSSFFEIFADPEKTKPQAIKPLLDRFPRRRFILVGDSGEKDPEVYGELARQYPGQIDHVFVRDVTGASAGAERYRRAFDGIATDRWTVFRDAKEIAGFECIRKPCMPTGETPASHPFQGALFKP